MSGTDDLRRLSADMSASAARISPEVRAVVKRGAQNIKTQMAADLGASQHFRGIAGSISYDMAGNAFFASAEIGPDKDRGGGALANIAYFGGARGGGGTVDLDVPLDAERPRMMKALDDLAGGVL